MVFVAVTAGAVKARVQDSMRVPDSMQIDDDRVVKRLQKKLEKKQVPVRSSTGRKMALCKHLVMQERNIGLAHILPSVLLCILVKI